jgi:hypothetical protein
MFSVSENCARTPPIGLPDDPPAMSPRSTTATSPIPASAR